MLQHTGRGIIKKNDLVSVMATVAFDVMVITFYKECFSATCSPFLAHSISLWSLPPLAQMTRLDFTFSMWMQDLGAQSNIYPDDNFLFDE